MKVLIIAPGGLPITSKKGAIEKLVENYLDYNEIVKDDIILYTPKISKTEYDKKLYSYTKYRYIDRTTIQFKIKRLFLGVVSKIFKNFHASAYINSIVKDLIRRKEENTFDCIIFENAEKLIPYFKNKTKTKSKIVLHLHNDYINKDLTFSKQITESCDEIWTVSDFIASRVQEVAPNKPIHVLYNGVDDKLFKQAFSESEKKQFASKLNIDLEKDFVYIYTGRLMPSKGVKELIQAFQKLNSQHINTKLLIIGGPKTLANSDAYTEELKNIQNNNSNIIMAGFVNTIDLYKYYSLANVQIVPSICNEAFGLTVLEGVINNLPVIATKIGGIPEILRENAFYVNKDNIVEELYDAMLKVKNLNKSELAQIISNYTEIIDKFSLKNYCETFKYYLGGLYEKK